MSSLPTIFISYSHKDSDYLAELLNAVTPTLSNVTTLNTWADEEIASGDHWESEILRALNAATAGVLLISNDFLNRRHDANPCHRQRRDLSLVAAGNEGEPTRHCPTGVFCPAA